MSIGMIEAIVVLGLSVICLPVGLSRKQWWLTAIPLYFAIAMCVTPADVVSLLIVAIPNAILGTILLRLSEKSRHAMG